MPVPTENWPENDRTIAYQLKVTNELNQVPGKIMQLFDESNSSMCSGTIKILEDRFDIVNLETQNNRADDTNYIDVGNRPRAIRNPKPAHTATLLGPPALPSPPLHPPTLPPPPPG